MAGLPLISSAFLTLTHACNMGCVYCFVHQNPDYMPYSVAQDAADFLYRNAEATGEDCVPGINFFGGEPLLCWDSVIMPLTKYIRGRYGNRFTLSVTTNGTLLDEARLVFMRENQIGMLLSMDGDRATQEYNRPLRDGRSSFDALEPKLGMILKYFPEVGFRATTIPATCERLMENVRFAERHGFPSFFTMPDHFADWREDHIAVLRAQAREFADYFLEACRAGRRPMVFPTFEKMFRVIRLINFSIEANERRAPDRCGSGGRCGLGGTHGAAVAPDGSIFTCQDMSSFEGKDSPFYIGNLHAGVDDARRLALMQDYDCRECSGLDCNTCRLDRICDGGCVANNFMRYGDIRKIPPVHCVWYQALLDEAIRVMGVLGTEGNEIFQTIWREAG